MSAMSDYLESQLLNHIFKASTFAKPTTIYVGITNTVPTDADTGATVQSREPTAGSYARKAMSVSDAQWSNVGVNGVLTNTSGVVFTATGGAFNMISGLFYADASGAGNILLYGGLTTPRDVLTGESLTFPSGNLSVTFA